MNKGKVFILSAPTGTGKTTLMKKLLNEFDSIKQSVSYTTRFPRPGEVPGKDYHFIGLRDFEQMAERNEFIEHVKLYGHHYGTSRKKIEEETNAGKHLFLVIDTQGGLLLKEQNYPATFIFISPPSLDELQKRLQGRSTETSSVIEERMACTARELEQGKSYDYQVLNDDLDKAYQELKDIFQKEIKK